MSPTQSGQSGAPSDRETAVRALRARASVLVEKLGSGSTSPSDLESVIMLESLLRQFFDSFSPQEPVSPEELTILRDVGALLDRAKTLAGAERNDVLEQLKGMGDSRTGIQAYRAANDAF